MSDLCVIPITKDCECECEQLREEGGFVTCLTCEHEIHIEQDSMRFGKLIAALGRFKLKETVIQHYGAVCVHCGFTDLRALSIDHVKGDGALHRKKINTPIYPWLKKNNYPDGFQVLCMNCQWIKRAENGEVRKQ